MDEALYLSMFFNLYYSAIFGISIAAYVVQALGLQTLANRRGIRHSWLAWLPVGNLWLLGAIADHYRHHTRNEKKNRRTALLVLSLVTTVLVIIALCIIFGSMIDIFLRSANAYYYNDDLLFEQFLASYLGGLGVLLLAYGVGIAQMVVQYICLYELYASSDPDNKVLFLLLSIVFGLMWIFIFICRKKDLGMQPPAPAYIPQNTYQPQYQPPQYQPPQYQPPQYQPPQYQPPTAETEKKDPSVTL